MSKKPTTTPTPVTPDPKFATSPMSKLDISELSGLDPKAIGDKMRELEHGRDKMLDPHERAKMSDRELVPHPSNDDVPPSNVDPHKQSTSDHVSPSTPNLHPGELGFDDAPPPSPPLAPDPAPSTPNTQPPFQPNAVHVPNPAELTGELSTTPSNTMPVMAGIRMDANIEYISTSGLPKRAKPGDIVSDLQPRDRDRVLETKSGEPVFR